MTSEKDTITPDAIAVPKETTAAMVQVTPSGIEITSLEQLMKFSRMLVADGAAPKSWSAGQVAIAIQSGLQVGLGLTGGIQQGVVINGIFSWRGQAAVALIQNSGKCKPGSLSFGCRGEGDDRVGYAVALRIGYTRAEERTFSVEDARLAKLWTKPGPWHDYPRRQLAWRALGFLARDVFPDVLGGFPLAEEAVDFEVRTERTSGSRPELPPPPSHDPLMDAIEGKVAIEEKVLQEEIEKGRIRAADCRDDCEEHVTCRTDVPTPPTEPEQPNLPDPDVDAETAVAPPTEAEQLPLSGEDSCPHGVVLSLSDRCPECDSSS